MTRVGKIGLAVKRWPLAPRLLFIAVSLSFCGAGHAAAGVSCQVGAPIWAPPAATAEDLPWASVWLGHFSGGRRFQDGYGQTLIDWRDDNLCFHSRQKCQAWIAELRRAYRHPEGYWTCLLLR